MMGLREIRTANRNPRKYTLSQLSDGQTRRNNAQPSAFWSEKPPYERANIANGESMETMAAKGIKINPVRLNNEGYRAVPNMASLQIASKEAKLPDVYFDAVKMEKAVGSMVQDLLAAQAQLRTAMSRVMLARNEDIEVQRETLDTLTDTMRQIEEGNSEVTLHSLVLELSNTIETAAPANPVGYIPHMGLQHAMHPIRKIVNAIKDSLRLTVA